ncbi:hypothetical protein B2I21_05680, partial [Chryseobacterium mucoviscidosis]
GMAASFNGLQNQFSLTANSFQNLQTMRENQVPLQAIGIESIQKQLIDDYQDQTKLERLRGLQPDLISMRSELAKGSEDDSNDNPGNEDKEDQDKGDEEEP